jgi:O-antigen ligase
MAVADIELGAGPTLTAQVHHKAGLIGLFGLLAAFTLLTLDGGEIAPRILSVILFVFAAAFLLLPFRQRLAFSLPAACLLFMACYGVVQTLWSPVKIVYDGWTGVLFWFAAATIAVVATQVFQNARAAVQFRLAFIFFGSAVCVLDLLQQASRTTKYYWLIPSKFHLVFGPFAYWNNFAQFVEITLPVTLWQGLARRKPDIFYLTLGALQIGAVAASGSRAGTVLVLAELIGIILIAYLRRRNRAFLFGAAMAVVLSTLWVYAAGSDLVIRKLQQNDQLNVRRDMNRSSIEMIKARPLTGWGLDTYVPVYRAFATYDDGTYVNRAHNDWLQWLAEGGVFFAAPMLAILGFSLRPAIRSGWGLGLVVVCLHAFVDYPFARLGVCGWYFALAAMLSVWWEEARTKGVAA